MGDGVFVVSKGFFVALNDYEKKVLKPLYEPTDLARYVLKNENSKQIIYSTKTIDSKNIPNLLDHLKRFKEIMDDRRENKNGRLEYYHLHWPRDEYFFKHGPKILAVRKCVRPTFSYTEKESYVMMSVNIIKTSRLNLKFFTGLLNSSLISFWLRHKGKMQGNNFQIDKEPLVDLPIMAPDTKSQIVISELVDQITGTLSENNVEQAQKIVHEYESQINQLIYKLYGLSPEEIAIIEG